MKEGTEEVLITGTVVLIILTAVLALGYYMEVIRANIWANAIRNVGCQPLPPPPDAPLFPPSP